MPATPPVPRLRARIGGLVKNGASPSAIEDARRDLRVAVEEQRIRDLVASWPPLTAEQRARLVAILAG